VAPYGRGGGDSLHWLSVKYPDTDGGYPWIIPLNTSGEEALTTAPGSMFQSRIVREKKNKSDKSGEHPIRLCVAMHLIILCDYFCFVTLFILTFLLLTARNQHVITFVSRYVIHAHVGHAVTNESCNNKEQP